MSAGRPTGGEILARTLKQAGVKRIFALHGGHLEALFKGCLEHDIELIDFRHEAGAGHAAEGYARATGELGVCIVTAGPGFANVVPAIVNANLDAVPTLFLIGAPPLRESETNPLQGGFDQIAVATPMTKWAHRITNTERFGDLTAMAVRKAMTGRRGAVVLELPIDVLHMTVDERDATPPSGLLSRPRPAPNASETDAALTLLSKAERPAIIVGSDARFSDCSEALARFADAANIPVFGTTRGLGLLPASHRVEGGNARNLGALALGGNPPDVVVMLGSRMGLFLGGRSGAVIPHGAKVIHVFSDAGELGRIRTPEVAIAGDARATLETFTDKLGGYAWPTRQDWLDKVNKAKQPAFALYPDKDLVGGIHPFHAAEAVVTAAGDGAIYAVDGGEAANWANAFIKVEKPGQLLSHGYLGCLGVGFSFAIAAQIANPGKRVVHVTGDGAVGFHLQEFDTMVRRNLPIINVVLNNKVWGMSIHGQQIMYGQNYSAISRLGDTQYANIAVGFGCHGETVTRYEDIAPAMARAIASGKPSCIDILTDESVVHPGTFAALGNIPEGSSDVMIPYYENVPVRAG